MKRTNPKKGRDEEPGFVPIGWDEALDTIARGSWISASAGFSARTGCPAWRRRSATAARRRATWARFPAFLSAWGPMDYGFGSGQGVKCVHSEHLYGEYLAPRLHRHVRHVLTAIYRHRFGNNAEVSGGVVRRGRHADARMRGIKRVQVEPHLSITGACSAEWVPIRPKTDAAFLFGADPPHPARARMGGSVRPGLPPRAHDFALSRRPERLLPARSGERQAADLGPAEGKAKPYDAAIAEPALDGTFTVPFAASSIGPDDERWSHERHAEARTGVHSKSASACARSRRNGQRSNATCRPRPSAASPTNIWRHACIGQTIEIEGRTLPLPPGRGHARQEA